MLANRRLPARVYITDPDFVRWKYSRASTDSLIRGAERMYIQER